MTLSDDKITEIFYFTDDFCKEFVLSIKKHLLDNKPKRKPTMSCSEVITIIVIFDTGGYRNMKHFYIHFVHLFSDTVSYNRFVELMQTVPLPMSLFLKTCCMGNGTGISFIDSTPIRVGNNKRIKEIKYSRYCSDGEVHNGLFLWF